VRVCFRNTRARHYVYSDEHSLLRVSKTRVAITNERTAVLTHTSNVITAEYAAPFSVTKHGRWRRVGARVDVTVEKRTSRVYARPSFERIMIIRFRIRRQRSARHTIQPPVPVFARHAKRNACPVRRARARRRRSVRIDDRPVGYVGNPNRGRTTPR